MLESPLANKLLAILFVAREPVHLVQLQEVFADLEPTQLEKELGALIDQFNVLQQACEIRRLGGGYGITTRPEHHDIVRAFLKTKPSAKLSLAALETLAVIAYKQPVTLPEIMDIRGIKGTSTIRTLLEKKLIETRGRRKVVGRPILYGTTKEFLLRFGLDKLADLPTLQEFEEILGAPETD